MSIIERNGPQSAEDIKVVHFPTHGEVRLINEGTGALMSSDFALTAETLQRVARECFEAGRRAKAAELRNTLGIP